MLNLFAKDFYTIDRARDEREAYTTLIEDVLHLLDVPSEIAMRDVDEMMEFETELANVCFCQLR